MYRGVKGVQRCTEVLKECKKVYRGVKGGYTEVLKECRGVQRC